MKDSSWYYRHTASQSELDKSYGPTMAREYLQNGLDWILAKDLLETLLRIGKEKEFFQVGKQMLDDFYDEKGMPGIVYQYFGDFCMNAGKLTRARNWWLKALRHGVKHPREIWKDLAACYIEMENRAKADHWLEKVLAFDREQPDEDYWDWMTYVPYYMATDRPERALALLLTIKKANERYQYDYYMTLANAYRKLGDNEKALKYYRLQVSTFTLDPDGYTALALAVYELENDVALAESYYLQAIEKMDNPDYYKDRIVNVYYSLGVICINEELFEKCWGYLLKYYQLKYPPEKAAIFESMIHNFPPIEDSQTGFGYYMAIKGFEESVVEESMLMPDNLVPTEEKALEKQEQLDLEKGFDFDSLKDTEKFAAN